MFVKCCGSLMCWTATPSTAAEPIIPSRPSTAPSRPPSAPSTGP